jgi:hypothetical protein
VSVTPAGFGGEGSIGVWIVPGDALLGGISGTDADQPLAPATGTGTQILQNSIVGWEIAGVMIDFPTVETGSVSQTDSFVAPTGIMIQRNTIADTCISGCGPDVSPDAGSFFGGAGIAIGDGGVTITNNWFRDNQVGIFNESPTVAIVENQFRSTLPVETVPTPLPAIITTQPLVGQSNWFDANQTHVNFTNLNPAPDEFDHNPFLPGWQIFVPPPPSPQVTPATPSTPTVVTLTFPGFSRIPSDGPFAFIANPFLLQQILGGGGGPSLGEIAPAAGGPGTTPPDCSSTPAEQIANAFLGGTLLGNPGGYQQILQCQ